MGRHWCTQYPAKIDAGGLSVGEKADTEDEPKFGEQWCSAIEFKRYIHYKDKTNISIKRASPWKGWDSTKLAKHMACIDLIVMTC